ncbi:hypothetical protein T310_8254 [Rasamsonia emersonii CBS 393.64]|uniref:Uncharacterized protein n=1 Tax=Rasamsonia emersonii (strain ATCC 16479 / CBS 393.64 / IMI 116815) TaxID=1408163 RepID=A0A0F4YHW7_RASE3|nr:hypothetical protein T310_8254 [Rasamsonia emersonii CBS 393.64]KKA17809.1 hypothetical protein T310_8254 [Rasamsonia emersonii CBS 393.64]
MATYLPQGRKVRTATLRLSTLSHSWDFTFFMGLAQRSFVNKIGYSDRVLAIVRSHRPIIVAQRPLLPNFADPAYSTNSMLRVQVRQLLPTSGDDFWYGGSGGVQLGDGKDSDKRDTAPRNPLKGISLVLLIDT